MCWANNRPQTMGRLALDMSAPGPDVVLTDLTNLSVIL